MLDFLRFCGEDEILAVQAQSDDELYEIEPRPLLKRRKPSLMLDFLTFGGEDEILAAQAQSDDELYEIEPRPLLKRRKPSLMLDFLTFWRRGRDSNSW